MFSPRSVVVIPVYKEKLTHYEKISFHQALEIFEKRAIRVISSKRTNLSEYVEIIETIKKKKSVDVDFVFFRESFFANFSGYSKMLLSKEFYRSFRSYDFLLIYQLDCFVFKDDLDKWANKGYDYIGAPWQEGWGLAKEDAPFIGVGNGGFSLRNIKNCLRVLNTFSYIEKPSSLFLRFRKLTLKEKIRHLPHLFFMLTIKNNTFHLFNDHSGHEDYFWGLIIGRKISWFRVCPINEAVSFSFEVNPRKLYQINNKKLPFGCHAWWKYDLDFWRPFIERQGYSLDSTLENKLEGL